MKPSLLVDSAGAAYVSTFIAHILFVCEGSGVLKYASISSIKKIKLPF